MQPINDYPNYLLSKDGRVFSTITSKYLKPYLVMGYPATIHKNLGKSYKGMEFNYA